MSVLFLACFGTNLKTEKARMGQRWRNREILFLDWPSEVEKAQSVQPSKTSAGVASPDAKRFVNGYDTWLSSWSSRYLRNDVSF